MNKNKILTHFLLCAAFFFLIPLMYVTSAATLDFNPSSVDVNTGETFELEIGVDAGDKEVLGVDALIEYDGNVLEVESITDGTYLEIGQKEYGESGKIYVAGVIESPGTSVTGEGVLAKILFKAIGSGKSTVKYVCEIGDTTETNILENSTDAPDLIECSSNGEAEITVDGGGSSSGGTNPNPTPSSLPKSGIYENIVTFSIIGVILFIIGFGVKIIL